MVVILTLIHGLLDYLALVPEDYAHIIAEFKQKNPTMTLLPHLTIYILPVHSNCIALRTLALTEIILRLVIPFYARGKRLRGDNPEE